MEFDFRLDGLFPTPISVVDQKLIPRDSPGIEKFGVSVVQTRIAEILNEMGKAGAKDQNLHHIITSAEKLRQSTGDSVVYFLLDFEANQVVGLLKIGRKKLFVYDQQGVQHEVFPICVLDFYIHESREQAEAGRDLFEGMLKNEGVRVEHMAFDQPSDKLISVLKLGYGLENMIPQANNFALFDGFFDQRNDYAGKVPWGGLDQPAKGSFDQEEGHGYAHGRTNSSGLTAFQDSESYNADRELHSRNGSRK